MLVLGLTVTTIVSAVLLNILIYSVEMLPITISGTVVICIVISVPTSLFIGYKMYKNQNLATHCSAS
jgi:hypothetical protein